MSTIDALVGELSVVTIAIGVVSGALVLSVLIGGFVYLRRNRRQPPPPQEPDSGQDRAVAAAFEAYQQRQERSEEAEIEAWEAELAERLGELESAFASLASRLGHLGTRDVGGSEVLRALASPGARGAAGRSTTAGTRPGSEEQERLLRRIAAVSETPEKATRSVV